MAREEYAAQVALLVRVLPHVAKEAVFALKGGTAINLFYRDLPRLSVDIDLTYLPLKNRTESLTEVDEALSRIASDIEQTIGDARVSRIAGGGGMATRLQVQHGPAKIKIETSPVLRGVVHNPQTMAVTKAVEDAFGFAEIQVVSFEDLYAGKIIAALDRQHPRDLFDIKQLYENEGLTKELLRTALVYLASSNRPAHELLDPGLSDLARGFEQEFDGMTREPVLLDDLVAARSRLIGDIRQNLDAAAIGFLRGLHEGTPDFAVIGFSDAAQLPAVRWKLQNVIRFKASNPDRHAEQGAALEALFTALES